MAVEWCREVHLSDQAVFTIRPSLAKYECLSNSSFPPSSLPATAPPVTTQTKDLTVSTFIPPGLGERLLIFDSGDYLLCVGYKKRGDFQLGLSGTCRRKETEKCTVEREIQEEIGMVFKEKATCVSTSTRHLFSKRFCKPRTYGFYEAGPTDLEGAGFLYTPEEERLDRARKVVCLVHGPYEEMVDLLKRIVEQPGFPSDGIDRFAILSVKDALNLATHLPSTC